MRIIVASANIFRRELTSYVLQEAGYSVREAQSLSDLLALIADAAPRAIVVDAQLYEPADEAYRAIRGRSAAPLLWLATPALPAPPLAADDPHGDTLPWSAAPADLRARLAALLGRRDDPPPPDRTRALGAE